MTAFVESRWRFSLAWLVLSAILLFGSFVRPPFIGAYVSWPLRFLATAALLYAAWKSWRPATAVVLEPQAIRIKGVRPGWWKLFQRWTQVHVRDEDIIDVRIGRIRERSLLGLSLPPVGEPSRSSSLQNFLWIRYKSGEVPHEIYYPDIYDIQDTKLLVSQLKERLGDKLTVF